jgi:hypothetical protein
VLNVGSKFRVLKGLVDSSYPLDFRSSSDLRKMNTEVQEQFRMVKEKI